MIKLSITAAGVAALTFACPGVGPAAAQTMSLPRADGTETSIDSLAHGERPTLSLGASELLDVAIDRAEYELGPGDLLAVATLGALNREYTARVTPEGFLVLPGLGPIPVLGRTLDAAQSLVRTRVRRVYGNTEAHVLLLDVRRFKIYVMGDTPAPGARSVSPITRVSEILDWDSNVTSGAVGSGESQNRSAIRRTAEIRRGGGEVVRVDLARFRLLGELKSNPRVREGDIVFIPPLGPDVEIRGEVYFPGKYQHKPGESLGEFLSLVNAGRAFPAAAADSLRLASRRLNGEREVLTMAVADAVGPPGTALGLQGFDIIYVPKKRDFGRAYAAEVRGEVANPGYYPIVPGVTTVRDLITIAGGISPTGSLVNAALHRNASEATATRLAGMRNLPPELLTEAEQRVLAASRLGGEDLVVVDFAALLREGGDVYDHLIRAGDRLVVPEHRDEVIVLGAVRQPGVVPYFAATSVEEFVELAGGFSRRADRSDIAVIRASTAGQLPAEDVGQLQAGDAVIVPYKKPFEWRDSLQTIGTVVTSVTSLYFTLRAIF